jgi:NIMA (never in mitosis gene a)-related kinase
MDVCFVFLFEISLDLLKLQFGQMSIYVVEKQSTKERFVMKMINIGQEDSEERKKAQKEIAAEINIGMTLGKDCPFLVRYLETFYHKNFCCLIMEYCELGDLQKELDSGKQYEEPVSSSFSFFILINFFLGIEKMVSSCWPWSCEASLS